MSPEQREINRRLRILEHAESSGNVCLTCRYFGIGRATFYRWKRRCDEEGRARLGRDVPGILHLGPVLAIYRTLAA